MCSPAQSPREALVATIRTRELAALQSLGVAAGGRALCSLSRAGTSVPAAKYHEGFAAALAVPVAGSEGGCSWQRPSGQWPTARVAQRVVEPTPMRSTH